MIRFACISLLSLALSSQIFAATKWENESSSEAANAIVMVENFENKNNLNVDDRGGNWSVEKKANGNSVFCNKISNGWSDLNIGNENWANYSISYKMNFETDEAGSVEVHIRKRNRKDYRAIVNKYGNDVSIKLLGEMLFADLRDSEWLKVKLSASGKEIGVSINDEKQVFLENDRLKQGGALIAVSPNNKVCIDDIVVTKIGPDFEVDVADAKEMADAKFDELLNGHGYDDYQKKIATEIINGLGDRRKNLVIYDGSIFQPPKSSKKQISDASLEYYYLIQDARPKTRPDEYFVVEASEQYENFKFSKKSHKKIDAEMQRATLFSFIYYEDGQIIYDELPPENRFEMTLNEKSYFASHSMGKSITSYLLGHAICQGYISSSKEIIKNWPLMKNTLYDGQPLSNLLNMSAGDSHVIGPKSQTFVKTGGNIHNQPLKISVSNEGELKDTRPISNASYSYSNLTSDILFNFIAHKVGNDFGDFLIDFYQKKIGIKYPVYLWLNKLTDGEKPTVRSLTEHGGWQYGISATRYDYLRIAEAVLNDWKNDTCEGRYLKGLYKQAVSTDKKDNTWKKWPGSSYPNFGAVAQRYAGQFYTSINGLHGKKVFAMIGADGQQIIVNLDDSRIVVIAAGQEGWYNTKSIAYDLIKSGKIKSNNWN